MIRATDIVLAVDKNKSRRIRDKSREREKHDLHICEMYKKIAVKNNTYIPNGMTVTLIHIF